MALFYLLLPIMQYYLYSFTGAPQLLRTTDFVPSTTDLNYEEKKWSLGGIFSLLSAHYKKFILLCFIFESHELIF